MASEAISEKTTGREPADPMVPEPYLVRGVRRETRDTVTLTLAPAGGGPAPPFAPGQFNMLYAFGVGEVPISVSGDPERPEALVHTVRAVGAVTKALCRLRKGEVLGVRGPFGTPWPVDAAPGHDVVIVAGGLGLAPLRPVVYWLRSRRAEIGNLELLYGARTPEDLLYRRELEQWRGRFDFRVHVTVDAARGDWRGNVGVVTTVIPRLRFDPAHTLALVCGPEIMMRFTVQDLVKAGVPPPQIFLSMERNMKCGVGLCGHCQWGPFFVCKDGPVFPLSRIQEWLARREI